MKCVLDLWIWAICLEIKEWFDVISIVILISLLCFRIDFRFDLFMLLFVCKFNFRLVGLVVDVDEIVFYLNSALESRSKTRSN